MKNFHSKKTDRLGIVWAPNDSLGTPRVPYSRESQIAPAFAKLSQSGKSFTRREDAHMRFPEHHICRIMSEVQKYSVWRFRVFEGEQDVDAPCHTISLWLRMVSLWPAKLRASLSIISIDERRSEIFMEN